MLLPASPEFAARGSIRSLLSLRRRERRPHGATSMTDQAAAIWSETGGSGRTVVLLHGVGATAAVWNGVRDALRQRPVGWMSVDLSGHGGSQWLSSYSVGQLAAALAPVLRGHRDVLIVGHSLGAYVGLALASGWFGVRVSGVLCLGPKIAWSDADLDSSRELAARPVRWYALEEEALTRYRRVSGLSAEIAPQAQTLARGVLRGEQGWRLAQDPGTFAAAGAPFATLIASAAAPVVLARGEHDTLVSAQELQRHAAPAHSIGGAGHNVHVERPAEVVSLLDGLIAHSHSSEH